jgi:uncharacterized protein (TIGR04222 family)
VEAYLIVCSLLLAASIVARAMPIVARVADDDERWSADEPWDPRSVGYLRQGPYGVVLTVLAELHARGAVDARVSGRIRQLDPPADGQYDDPLSIAVYLATRWCREPHLIALLPAVRRACGGLRPGLVQRGLLPSLRRRLFAWTLLAYAAGLALATAAEHPDRSTVVGAAVVTALALALSAGPRRTVAGHRVLIVERQLLAVWTADHTYSVGVARLEPLLASMVAAQGRAALDVLCDGYVAVGAVAPKRFTVARPRLVPRPMPPTEVEPISFRIPAPPVRRARTPSVYDTLSEGPAIVVRRAFLDHRDRIAT